LAITREKKETLVAEYVEKLRRAEALIITEYRGLTVKQFEALRRELREADSEIVVSKNTLMARALVKAGLPVPESLLTGSTAVAFCFSDLAAPAKTLSRHVKDTKILTIRGGMLGHSILDEAGAQSLANLPSRDQLRAQVVGMLQAPIAGLVNVLAGSLRGMLNVLNARVAQLEEAA